MFKYFSPLGTLYLASDGTAITGLWMENQKYFPKDSARIGDPALPVFQEAAAWLDCYFAKKPLPPLPPLEPRGSEFQKTVWKQLLKIPYGKTTTYKEIAQALDNCPRAVGGAVGRNPISIFIPCHRVLGSGGSLTGYAGGVEQKKFLLELEGVL